MSILDVRHQSTAQILVQRALSSERVPHAYIFCGASGVGREMLAVRFANLLLCPQAREVADPPAEYAKIASSWQDVCGSCQACTLFRAGTHPDFHLVHRRLNKLHPDAAIRSRKSVSLGIDVIRHFVIDEAHKKPTMGQGRVFVIQEAETLNDAAQNALLKTLEEPPRGTYLILVTRSLDSLLPTTRSRCQVVNFWPLPSDYLEQQLRSLRQDAEEPQILYFARHEPGSLGAALQLLDDGFYACNQKLTESLAGLKREDSLKLASQLEKVGKEMGAMMQKRVAESLKSQDAASHELRMQVVGSTSGEMADATESSTVREALRRVLAMMATWYRDVINICTGSSVQICNLEAEADLKLVAQKVDVNAACLAIRAIAEAEYELDRLANVRLCLDSLGIKLARLAQK